MEPGRWTVSCSGHVDRGESFEGDAIREMEEELGVLIKSTSLVALLYSDPAKGNGFEFVRSYEVTHRIYPMYNPEEISEIREIELAELDVWIKKEPQQFASSFYPFFPSCGKVPIDHMSDIWLPSLPDPERHQLLPNLLGLRPSLGEFS